MPLIVPPRPLISKINESGVGLCVDRVLPPDVLATGAAVTAADTGW
jgi:hypothetical protein